MSEIENGGWQPIETAPKDGKTPARLRSAAHSPEAVFLWRNGRWETRVFALAKSYTAWWDENEEQPTEWRPPSTEPEARADG